MAIDTNGLPTIVSDGTLTDAEAQAVINAPAQPEVTFSSLLRGFMDVSAAAVSAIIDPVTRLFKAGQAAQGTVMLEELLDATKVVRITPDAGQTGRSLTWASATEGVVTAALSAAMEEIVTEVKPKISVESLLGRVLAAIPEAVADKCIVSVNQTTGEVSVHEFDSAAARATAAAAVAAINIAAYPAIEVTLSEPAAAGGAEPLIFEGGSTGE